MKDNEKMIQNLLDSRFHENENNDEKILSNNLTVASSFSRPVRSSMICWFQRACRLLKVGKGSWKGRDV